MQLAWIGAVPITPEWQESVAGSTIRGQFVRRFSSIYGDIQQHDISCLCDGITTRQDVSPSRAVFNQLSATSNAFTLLDRFCRRLKISVAIVMITFNNPPQRSYLVERADEPAGSR